jgi:hypothetical protein
MPYHYRTERKNDFHICTSCFSLTDLTKRTSQRCKCEPKADFYSWDPGCNFLLCVCCARVITGGESRYSWLGCDNCRRVNRFVPRVFHGQLPLCRHSIGNTGTISMELVGEALEKRISQTLESFSIQGQLREWRDLLARELFESAPEWQNRQYIHTAEWEVKFPSTLLASTIALQGFFGLFRFAQQVDLQPELNLELMELSIKKGLITKSGNWYRYGEFKWQGVRNESQFCAGNQDIRNELLESCYDAELMYQIQRQLISLYQV